MARYQHPGWAPAYAAMALCIASSTQADDWGTYEWEVACIDPVDCAPADEIYTQQLKAASEWLSGLGFPAPAAFNSLDLGHPALDYRVANISDADVESRGIDVAGYYDFDERMIWLRSENYFTLGDPGQTHDDQLYQAYNTTAIASVHELFHAVQNADEYTLPPSPEFRWLWEGTATAVMLAYGREVEPDTEVMFRRRRHDFSLHEPNLREDAYGTAFFWLFLGTELQSTARIAYLDQLLRQDVPDAGGEAGADVWDTTGVRGVDTFLAPYGGLFALFPRFLATLTIDGTFGDVAQWQARLPAGQTQATRHFRGNVRKIAGTAARLSVSHSSEKAVTVEIRFRGDDSDLHLIADGKVRVLGPGGVRNTFATQMQSRSQTLELVIAEVAEQAERSTDRAFELEVELREEPAAWVRLNGETFEVSPHVCNSQGVLVDALPNARSILFRIMAGGNSTRITAWGDSSVGAYLFSEGLNMSSYGYSQDDGGGGAGGPPPADNPPARFQVDMAYDMERGQWTGSGTLHSRRHGLSQVEFSIQCRPESRKIIR